MPIVFRIRRGFNPSIMARILIHVSSRVTAYKSRITIITITPETFGFEGFEKRKLSVVRRTRIASVSDVSIRFQFIYKAVSRRSGN